MRLPVHVTPKSGRGEVIGWRDGADGQRELEVKVKAAPEKRQWRRGGDRSDRLLL